MNKLISAEVEINNESSIEDFMIALVNKGKMDVFGSELYVNDYHETENGAFIFLVGSKSERLVSYELTGDNEKVIARGKCMVANDEWEMSHICKHAHVPMNDIYSMLVEDK